MSGNETSHPPTSSSYSLNCDSNTHGLVSISFPPLFSVASPTRSSVCFFLPQTTACVSGGGGASLPSFPLPLNTINHDSRGVTEDHSLPYINALILTHPSPNLGVPFPNTKDSNHSPPSASVDRSPFSSFSFYFRHGPLPQSLFLCFCSRARALFLFHTYRLGPPAASHPLPPLLTFSLKRKAALTIQTCKPSLSYWILSLAVVLLLCCEFFSLTSPTIVSRLLASFAL